MTIHDCCFVAYGLRNIIILDFYSNYKFFLIKFLICNVHITILRTFSVKVTNTENICLFSPKIIQLYVKPIKYDIYIIYFNFLHAMQ